MSSLKKRIVHQRETLMERSADIHRRGNRVQKRLISIGVDLGSLEWKNGRVSIQVSQRMGILFLVASIAGLILLTFRVRT